MGALAVWTPADLAMAMQVALAAPLDLTQAVPVLLESKPRLR